MSRSLFRLTAGILLRTPLVTPGMRLGTKATPVTTRLCSTSTTISPTTRPDRLFSRVSLELRAHQPDVLRSYAFLTKTTARNLDVHMESSHEEPEPHKIRKTILKSAAYHSKHRVQYEFQTYFWTFSFLRLTESTKNTMLEYLQRNLPEGVSMKVTETELRKWPESIEKAVNKEA